MTDLPPSYSFQQQILSHSPSTHNHTNFSGDASTVIGLQGALKFNGGGHINHSIFWQNLCPTSDSGEPSPELMAAIERDFGSLDSLKEKLSASTVAVQGSGNICNILQINFLKSH